MNPLVIVELSLRIVLAAMEGQTADQRKKIWDWWITDVERLRTWLKIDDVPKPPKP